MVLSMVLSPEARFTNMLVNPRPLRFVAETKVLARKPHSPPEG